MSVLFQIKRLLIILFHGNKDARKVAKRAVPIWIEINKTRYNLWDLILNLGDDGYTGVCALVT